MDTPPPRFFPIINNALVNILIYIKHKVLQDIYTYGRNCWVMGSVSLQLCQIMPKDLPKWSRQFTLLPALYENFNWPQISPTIGIIRPLHFCHFGSGMASLCGWNCGWNVNFHIFIGHLDFSLCKEPDILLPIFFCLVLTICRLYNCDFNFYFPYY